MGSNSAGSSGASRRPQFVIRLFPHRGVALLTNPTPDERTIMAAHRNYVEVLANRGVKNHDLPSRDPGDRVCVVAAEPS